MLSEEEYEELVKNSSKVSIDSTDFKILCFLEREGKQNLEEIANKIDLSSATISTRLKRLEDAGIFIKYVPLIRIEKLGFARDLVLLIQTEPGTDFEEISTALRQIDTVKSLYKLIGEYDLLVQLCCRGDTELARALNEINLVPGITKISKSMIQHKLKENFHDLTVDTTASDE